MIKTAAIQIQDEMDILIISNISKVSLPEDCLSRSFITKNPRNQPSSGKTTYCEPRKYRT
jgi:hypothetical protein